MAKRVLVAVGEPEGRAALGRALGEEGYAVAEAATGSEAVVAARRLQPDALVLDGRFADMTGAAVVAAVREETNAPILVLTGEDDAAEQIGCLRAGADVCVPKPYSIREVQARVLAMIRRVDLSNGRPGGGAEVEHLGDFRLDRAARTVHVAGTEVELTLKEFDLLSFLLAHAGRVQSRERILEQVWGNALGDRRTVNVHVRWLREKLNRFDTMPLRITTVTRAGYRLDRLDDRAVAAAGAGVSPSGAAATSSPRP
ncbi:MAG TPA: response regulator transcription factor [Candidatus Dormibacteraeota bacterium]